MTKLKTWLMVGAGCAAIIALAVFYHWQITSSLEKLLGEAEQALQKEQKAFDDFRADLLRETVKALEKNSTIVADVMRQREEKQNEIRQEGKTVTATIVAHTAAPGEANLDLPLPRSMAGGLAGLHRTAAGAGAGTGAETLAAAGGDVSGKTPASAAGNHDAQNPGRLDGGTPGLGR